jgi:signal transduction histidine kinase
MFERPFPGFLLMESRVIPSVGTDTWPPEREKTFHAQVVSIDGRPLESGSEIDDAVRQRPTGTVFRYGLRKNDASFEIAIPSRPWTASDWLQTYGVLYFFAASSITMAVLVGFLQPRTRQARVFVWQALVAGTYAATGVFLHRPEFWLLGKLCLVLECLFPATFIHLALVFPSERPGVRWWHLVLPYGTSLALAGFVLLGLAEDPPRIAPLQWNALYTAASIVFFVGAMAWAYFENREPLARPRLKALIPGLVLGTGSMLVIFLDHASETSGVIPHQAGLLAPTIFYASIGYAIAKHDLFDVDRLVRQSVIYGALTILIVSVYAGVLTVARSFAEPARPILTVGFILAIAILLNPLRERIQHVVDRAFYRDRLDYQKMIGELSELLASLLRLDDIGTRLTKVVGNALHLESAGLYVRGASAGAASLWLYEPRKSHRIDGDDAELEALTDRLARIGGPVDFAAAQPSGNGVAWPERFRSLDVRAALPLVTATADLGVILLGPKRSGQPLGSDELKLLRTLASQAAIALQNARSYRELEELTISLDEKVRDRTRELVESHRRLEGAYEDLKAAQAQVVQSEKMASLGQLVAGVAHELNNPASFVSGGIENLAEYLPRLIEALREYESLAARVADAGQAEVARIRERTRLDYLLRETPELLRICAEGSERIRQIVNDLRIFARPDSGDRVATDLAASIDSTVSLLQHRLKAAAIAVDRRYETVPPLECNAAQLNQVWMNLLSNAIDAVEGRDEPRIAVAIRRSDGGEGPSIEVRVSDNGCGIPPEARTHIFNPFFTTKPLGKGTGLGLSIAYAAVKAHRGAITVESTVEQGTTVAVRIPLDAQEEPRTAAP